MRAWEGAIIDLHALGFRFVLTLQRRRVLHYTVRVLSYIFIWVSLCLDEMTCTARTPELSMPDPCRRGLAQATFSCRLPIGH